MTYEPDRRPGFQRELSLGAGVSPSWRQFDIRCAATLTKLRDFLDQLRTETGRTNSDRPRPLR